MRPSSVELVCPVCEAPGVRLHAVVDGFSYFECGACESLSLDAQSLADIDAGTFVRSYDVDYWKSEVAAARDRSWGAALARVAEVLLYAKLPVTSFIDIGTGPGFLLDSLSTYLPASRKIFWGVEAFPPQEHSNHSNYWVGHLGEMHQTFQAGCCIEVLEHLTPSMARNLALEMAARSEPGALYIFNTGLPKYVKREDPRYLDPLRRGHIVSYGLEGVRHLFGPAGFSVIPLPGKDWAFLLEFGMNEPGPIVDRIWHAREENRNILMDPQMGSVMYMLGLETARAYG